MNPVLQAHLAYLKLADIEAQCEALAADAATKGWTHVEYLRRLLEGECRARQQRAIERRVRDARFPVIKTLDGFRWDWPKKINELQVKNLLRLSFVEKKTNVILMGGVGLGKSHVASALGYTQDGRFAEAEQSYERALALNPNSIFAHHMRGQNLFCTGDLEASFEEFRKAIALDPLVVISQQTLGFGLYFVHRLPEAADALDRAVAIRPDVFIPTHGYRVRLLLDMGKTSEALATARLIRQKSAVFPRWASDAYALDVLLRAGTKEEAAEYANELLARLPAESWVRGFVLSVLGRYDEAVPYLERTPQIYTPALFLDTIWDAYRENPKYVALVAKMGRTEEYKTARQTLARMVKEQAAKK